MKPRPDQSLAMLPAAFLFVSVLHAADPFAEGVRTTDPLPPEAQQKKFRLPPGFEIQLVASEPDLRKPMNMAFDARGRLWVTESREYPFAAPLDKPGRDTIRIFSDFDENGHARKVQIFADGLNIPIGIYPLPRGSRPVLRSSTAEGGREAAPTTKSEIRNPKSEIRGDAAIVWSIPNIWLMEDTDGDGKADRREALYGPFDHTRDTHGNQASFRRGFDGWLYATHGYNNDSHVKGRDGNEVHLNSGNTYRMRLDGSRIEHYTWGQVNPFGLAWDPLGNLYSSDCHSAPVYQLLAGGYYPSFGKPHDGLGFAPVLMEHSHGSTAIDGIVYYADDLWPDEFKDNVFVGNVMTSRVNRDRLAFNGSTPKANELDDFVKCDDPWFRPVDNQLGPDGAFYIADFYNRIIGHYEVPLTHPGRDRERGRIWRVVYKGSARGSRATVGGSPTASAKDDAAGRRVEQASGLRSPKLPDDLDGLIAELGSPNLTRRMLAMNDIADRFGSQAVEPLRKAVQNLRGTSSAGDAAAPAYRHLHALWLLERLGALDESTIRYAATRANPMLRTHVMRILTARGLRAASSPDANAASSGLKSALQRLAITALGDSDALVQRCAAEALGVWPAFETLRPLLNLRQRVSTADSHLLYGVRKAIRDHLNDDKIFGKVLAGKWSDADLAAFADVAVAVKSPLAGTFLLRQLERTTVDRETGATWLRHIARYAPAGEIDRLAEFARGKFADDLDLQFALFKSVQEGMAQRGARFSGSVRDWGANLAERLLDSSDPDSIGWGISLVEGMPDTTNPWFLQRRASADGNKDAWFICSLPPGGEHLTGVLRSRLFTIPAKLSFFMAGHDGYPDKPAQKKNAVRLRAAGTQEVLAEASPPRHDTAQRFIWDLSVCAGRQGYLEIVDADNGDAYAWLAVGRFDPPAVALPAVSPSRISQRQQAAAELAASLGLRKLEAPLQALLQKPDTDLDARAAAARALVAFYPDGKAAALVALVADKEVPAEWRERLAASLSARDAGFAQKALTNVFGVAPHRTQIKLARMLAGHAADAEGLLVLAEAGTASARLLLDPTVKDKLLAAKPANAEARLAKLTSGLTPLNEELQKLIERRRSAYDRAKASAARGEDVFRQNCAVCHRIDGQGGLVGPQLDGIGNRGLERLLEDVLDPNRNVDRAFRTHTLTLRNGDILSGLPRREEGELLMLADSTGKEISIPKKDIQDRRESDTSLMPENFGEAIPLVDFNDLTAFLLSKRGSQAN